MEDVRQTLFLHLPVFRQVSYDLAGFGGFIFYHLVIEGADRRIDGEVPSHVGVPRLRVANIENSRMPAVHHPSRSRAGRRRHRRQRRGTEPEASNQTSLEEAPPGDLTPTVSRATGLPVHRSPPAPLKVDCGLRNTQR